MNTWLLKRIGQSVLVLWITFTVAFLLLQALPGDSVVSRYGNPELGLSDEQLADIRQSLGADRPILAQYFLTLTGFLTLNFGYSAATGASVEDLIVTALPQTLALAGLGFGLAVVLAVIIAVTASFGPFDWLRKFFAGLPSLFVSIPAFWLGIVLIQIISFQLGLIPVLGASAAEALVLPVITISIPIAAPLAQILHRSIEETLQLPFINVVRARGASTWWLLSRNVVKNALLPVLTIGGVLVGELIAGAVVIETVFGRSGVGRLTESAVATRDLPVLQAVVVLSATVFIVINLIVDLLYPVLDARLRRKVAA